MDARESPLAAAHAESGARFTAFGGWEMPVRYGSIRAEHRAVRGSAGKFDVSHMGRIGVSGPDAVNLTNHLTTNDVAALDPGEAQYAMITDEDGVILDDTLVYRRGPDDVLFVPNAGHDREMADRWERYRDEWGMLATVENTTEDTAMIAVQGPDAPDIVADITPNRITDLGRMEATRATVADGPAFVARTGYTGEDGFELVVDAENAPAVWEALPCDPCGLGARDTLRLEQGFLLSRQDFHPEENPRTPYEAGVGFTVKLDTEFVGRDALEGVQAEGVEETISGVVLVDRGVPRHGHTIADRDGTGIGTITSGSMSPTLGEPIALGYVPVRFAEPGTTVRVIIRDEPKKAKTSVTPFID